MGCRILVVDDSPIVFKMIKKALEPAGFEVVGHAIDGKIAIDMYGELIPDVVTMDVTMPVMGGLEASKKIFDDFPNAKIIILSAMGDDNIIEQARQIGIDHFMEKPVDSEQLIEMIERILSIKK